MINSFIDNFTGKKKVNDLDEGIIDGNFQWTREWKVKASKNGVESKLQRGGGGRDCLIWCGGDLSCFGEKIKAVKK